MVEPPAVNTNTAGDTVIHVLAIITTKPGMRDTVLNHFRANVPAVLALEKVGPQRFLATLRQAGVSPRSHGSSERPSRMWRGGGAPK